MGKRSLPRRRPSLLITADAGGSNGYRVRAWKVELAKLATETGLEITVCHYPPGTSKWNRIEHRMFSFITMNWRGRPSPLRTIIELISATTTKTGSSIQADDDLELVPDRHQDHQRRAGRRPARAATSSTATGTTRSALNQTRREPLVLTPPAAKEVRVFGLGGWAAERFESLARARILAAWAARTGQTVRYVVAAACFGAAMGIGMAWIGLQAVHGAVDLTGVLVVAVCLSRALAPPNIIADVPVAYGIFAIPAILRAEEAVRSGPADLGGTVPLRPAPQHHIELRDLTFGYPSGNEAVLEHLDLTIPAGQRLAIVGLSGSGKTTLIKLLCRLYDPDAGAVVVDGLDLRQADPLSWRENIAALFQDFIRWSLSVADNVSLLEDRPSEAATNRAIAAGGAEDIIDKLPSGIDTVLSTSSTGGVDLSGGQWQRIALARALRAVHAGARLLVLDEPTANLDPKGELEFYDAVLNSGEFGDRAHPVTTILISHRFPTVRHADRIVVLDAGRIAEDGTHDELVRAGGRYATMFSAQAAAFAQAET